MARLSVLPPKPIYEGEQPVQVVAETSTPETAPPAPSPHPRNLHRNQSPNRNPPSEPEVPEGAYNAEVIQPIGLVMREGPGTSFPQVGGVDYEAEVIVLEESADQPWMRVRVVANGQEGWVKKTGNTRRTRKLNPFSGHMYQGQIGMNEFLRRKAPLLNLEWPYSDHNVN